ncbi:ABC transporter permease subunit [Candidatus Parcubacteria bacterium]|nr:ABC transporter permease subunit [Candidatus Parcubacteria bacterium]
MRRKTAIYRSWRHVIITVCVTLIPFIFLLVFAEIARITLRQLFFDIFISGLRLAVAYIIAISIAWLTAVLFYKGKLSAFVLPLADVLQSFPTFAALPLATLVWGATNTTVILFLAITIIWPVFFTIISSLKLIKKEWDEAAEVTGLGGLNYVNHFLLPITMPGVITGTIIGLGDGWEALVATEIIIGIKSGLGSFFQSYTTNTTITTFGIIGLLVIIFTINKLIWLPLLEMSHAKIDE